MVDQQMPAKKTASCPVCRGGPLRPRIISEEVGPASMVSLPVEVCPFCDETFYGPEAGRLRLAALRKLAGV